VLRPLDWSHRIAEALERDLFVLHGQRIVDVVTGATMRHELFLRMVDRRRFIPAGEFVMAAEEFGSIREIDRWVVGRAIEVAATGRPVDVNLSLRSTDQAMLELIRDRIVETGAKPSDIVLELSERQLAAQAETRGDFVHAVSGLGCQIALDAFEKGGHNAFLLKQFPIGYVKLGPHSLSTWRLIGTGAARWARLSSRPTDAASVSSPRAWRTSRRSSCSRTSASMRRRGMHSGPRSRSIRRSVQSLERTQPSMRLRGVEPPRPEGHRHLKPARLPVPPQPRAREA
jgi:hypothetical protein